MYHNIIVKTLSCVLIDTVKSNFIIKKTAQSKTLALLWIFRFLTFGSVAG